MYSHVIMQSRDNPVPEIEIFECIKQWFHENL